MLRHITVTQHGSVERWDTWIVSVPDDMGVDEIEEVVREIWERGELELGEEEADYDDDPSVDVSDAPGGVTEPYFVLNDWGIVDEERTLSAFTTESLQAELERRRAKESDQKVA